MRKTPEIFRDTALVILCGGKGSIIPHIIKTIKGWVCACYIKHHAPVNSFRTISGVGTTPSDAYKEWIKSMNVWADWEWSNGGNL